MTEDKKTAADTGIGQAISWVMISILGRDIDAKQMDEALAEAINTVVAAEHGDAAVQQTVLEAAAAFSTTVKLRQAIRDHASPTN